MYHIHLQKLGLLAEAFSNWVRFGKRTKFEGVYEELLPRNGFVSGKTKPPWKSRW
jgi:hypothetical protein